MDRPQQYAVTKRRKWSSKFQVYSTQLDIVSEHVSWQNFSLWMSLDFVYTQGIAGSCVFIGQMRDT